MEMLEEAGFADAVRAEPGFQLKNGAAFSWGSRYTEFDFTDKFSDGPGTTYQVRRAVFDKILIEEAADSTNSTEPIHLVLQHLRESFSLS